MHRSLRRFLALLGSAVMAAALAGCAASTPAVHLQTLMPSRLAPRAAAGDAALPILLEPIRLPAQVDQPQLLVRLPDRSLVALEQERWAGPLRDEFRQALLEELAAHAGVVEARGATAGAPSPVRVGIDVRRFDSVLDREARIEGSWSLAADAPGALPWRCDWLIREPAAAGIAALAAAHRRAVVRLADGLGDSLVALRRGGPRECPPSDPR